MADEPLVLPEIWRAVMQEAGYRCQCAGACGAPHLSGEGRCPRTHTSTPRPVRLYAAPADPSLRTEQAARLPGSALRAWCSSCLDGARRAGTRTTRGEPAQHNALFTL